MTTPEVTLNLTQFNVPLQVLIGERSMGFSDRQRVLLLLMHYKSLDLSYEEISAATGLGYDSVKARARELEVQGLAYRSDRKEWDTGCSTRTLQYREESSLEEIPPQRFRMYIRLSNKAAKKQLLEFMDKMTSEQKDKEARATIRQARIDALL